MAKKRANGEGNIRKRKDDRWEGRYTAGHDPETGKAICKNDLGKTRAEIKAKLKAAVEETKSLDVTKAGKYTAGMWMDKRFENYVKIKVRPSTHQTYRGVHRQPYQAQYRGHPAGKAHLSGIAEALQEVTDQRPGRPPGGQRTAQGAQCQDSAEHPANSVLCLKTGPGAADHPRQPGGGLRPA